MQKKEDQQGERRPNVPPKSLRTAIRPSPIEPVKAPLQ
jgi:hypothetical protein